MIIKGRTVLELRAVIALVGIDESFSWNDMEPVKMKPVLQFRVTEL